MMEISMSCGPRKSQVDLGFISSSHICFYPTPYERYIAVPGNLGLTSSEGVLVMLTTLPVILDTVCGRVPQPCKLYYIGISASAT
jgi:hypothetical protein